MNRAAALPFRPIAETGGARAGHRAAGLPRFAAAYAGAVAAYMPLLTLLLPLRIEAIAPDIRFGLLTVATLAGAVVAAAANIAFGWASDLSGTRRTWIAAGLAGTLASYALLAAADDPIAIVVAVMLFQAALNMMLAPLMALMAETVPDARKGTMAGLMAGAQPAASLLCPALIAFGPAGFGAHLGIVGTIAAACLLPVLLLPPAAAPVDAVARAPVARRDLVVAWVARSLFQVAGSVLFAFLLYVMEGFAGGAGGDVPARVGTLVILANLAPLPVALLLGRWSDKAGRRKPFVLAAAILAAAGLATMGTAPGWTAAAAGYCLYAIGGNGFLSLQAGFAMELLPDPRRRGRDLGLLNLANTLPTLVGPVLAWWLAGPRDVSALLLTLAVLSLAGGVTMLGVRGRR